MGEIWEHHFQIYLINITIIPYISANFMVYNFYTLYNITIKTW